MARVLAVDDEPGVLTAVGRGLERIGHEVVVARTGVDALATAAATDPEVVVLDLFLPDIDGIEVVRRLRSWSDVPILLLSGAGTEQARVGALDAGADDFVDKPFSMEELRARIEAALRRSSPVGDRHGPNPASPRILAEGALRIDLAQHRLEVDGEPRRLTPIEWRLLGVLLDHPHRLLSYRQVIDAVWGTTHGEEARDALRVHLRSLRRKLGDDAAQPRYVVTEAGVGYRWVAEEAG